MKHNTYNSIQLFKKIQFKHGSVNFWHMLTLVSVFVLVISLPSFCSSITFTSTVDRTTLSVGEHFRLTATLESSNEFPSVSTPALENVSGIEILGSVPMQSSNVNIGYINGRLVRQPQYRYIFTYSLRATDPGTHRIPGLDLTIGNRTFSTDPVTITVVEREVSNPDIRVKLEADKRHIYPGEQVVLTFKVAQRAGASIHQIQRGFQHATQILHRSLENDFSVNRLFTNQISSGKERYNGEIYNTYYLRYALFPLSSGKAKINRIPFEYDKIVQSSRGGNSIFNEFYGSGFFSGGRSTVKQSVFSNPLDITIKPLPLPRPEGFSGSVGKFSLDVSVNKNQASVGDGLTMRVKVKGNTRPSGLTQPQVPQMKGWEVFTPERQVKVDTTSSGLFTSISFNYLIIPRQEGQLRIDPVSYLYLDPETGNYITAESQPLNINVMPGVNISAHRPRSTTQEGIKQIGGDIRYIKRDKDIVNTDPKPYRNPLWVFLLLLPFLIVFSSFGFSRYRKLRQKNSLRITRQKALKSALTDINKLKKQGSDLSVSNFLKRINSVIENYISAKFSFTPTGRTLEELRSELLIRSVDHDTVDKLTKIMEQIDEFRFGGKSLNEYSRQQLFDQLITFLQNIDKNSQNQKSKIILPLLLLIVAYSVSAQTDFTYLFNKANDYYDREDFENAKKHYLSVIDNGVNHYAVYFNLGNVYYRLNKPGLARVQYEKAALLNPADSDIQENIKFLRMTNNANLNESALSILSKNRFNLREMLLICFFLLLVVSILVSICFFTGRKKRAALIPISAFLSLPLIFFGITAGYTIFQLETIDHAIIVVSSANAKNQPHGSRILFTANEGTKVTIRRENYDWSLIALPDGMSGWVRNESIEPIIFCNR
ncbi:aerotolerance regulator BatD/BadE [Chitinispirillum alkaliphilum]|nr:aerotolerance regulator BatD/BadE [Chitinispirillum alkaliphilum]